MSDEDNNEFNNPPDLNKVAYDVAVETIVKIYLDLREKGLGRLDAATIVACMLKSDEPGEFPDGR